MATYTFYPGKENKVFITANGTAYTRATGIRLQTEQTQESYLILPDSFNQYGGWKITNSANAYNSQCLTLKTWWPKL